MILRSQGFDWLCELQQSTILQPAGPINISMLDESLSTRRVALQLMTDKCAISQMPRFLFQMFSSLFSLVIFLEFFWVNNILSEPCTALQSNISADASFSDNHLCKIAVFFLHNQEFQSFALDPVSCITLGNTQCARQVSSTKVPYGLKRCFMGNIWAK